MTLHTLATTTGMSYTALRKRNSILGIPSDARKRRTVIKKLIGRGTSSEISEFIRLHLEMEVSPAAVRMSIHRLKKAA